MFESYIRLSNKLNICLMNDWIGVYIKFQNFPDFQIRLKELNNDVFSSTGHINKETDLNLLLNNPASIIFLKNFVNFKNYEI